LCITILTTFGRDSRFARTSGNCVCRLAITTRCEAHLFHSQRCMKVEFQLLLSFFAGYSRLGRACLEQGVASAFALLPTYYRRLKQRRIAVGLEYMRNLSKSPLPQHLTKRERPCMTYSNQQGQKSNLGDGLNRIVMIQTIVTLFTEVTYL